jgi:hypothetical protein
MSSAMSPVVRPRWTALDRAGPRWTALDRQRWTRAALDRQRWTPRSIKLGIRLPKDSLRSVRGSSLVPGRRVVGRVLRGMGSVA